MTSSEFENIVSLKVVDICVFFNPELESAQSDIWLNSYAQITTDAQNWNFQNCTLSKRHFKFPISKINISSPIIALNWPKFRPKWFHWDLILFYLQNKLKHIKTFIKPEKLNKILRKRCDKYWYISRSSVSKVDPTIFKFQI